MAHAIRCGGAPQKICYLAEDYFRRTGVRDKSRVIFASPGASIFGIPKYRPALERVVASCPDATLRWVPDGNHSFEVAGRGRPADEVGGGIGDIVAEWLDRTSPQSPAA